MINMRRKQRKRMPALRAKGKQKQRKKITNGKKERKNANGWDFLISEAYPLKVEMVGILFRDKNVTRL